VQTVLLGLRDENFYFLQICSKGTGLLCFHQNIKIQTVISSSAEGSFSSEINRCIPVLDDSAFSVFQHDSRTTEVDELLFHGSFKKHAHKTVSQLFLERCSLQRLVLSILLLCHRKLLVRVFA